MGDNHQEIHGNIYNSNISGGDMIVGKKITIKSDLKALAQDLSRLQEAMKSEAESTSPDHYFAIGHIAAAQQAASTNDREGTTKHLESAGQWALDVATKIGTTLATAAIKPCCRVVGVRSNRICRTVRN